MGSGPIAPPDGYELDQPNAMRQGFGRLALSPGKMRELSGNAMALVRELANRAYGKYEALSKAALDSSPYGVAEGAGEIGRDIYGRAQRATQDSRMPTQIPGDELAQRALLAPEVMMPAFGRALGGAGVAAEVGAAGGRAARSAWTPTMVRKLVELDKQFASETARGARTEKVIENFREFYRSEYGREYPGTDSTIKSMAGRAKMWGGVNEETGAAAAAGGADKDFELGAFGGRRGARNMMAAGREGPTKVLDMAEKMEAAGMDYAATRRAVNQWIEKNDPALGGVTQGVDGKWRFEISDKGAKLTPELQSAFEKNKLNKRDFTVGEGLDHPELYQMHPDIAGMEMRVNKSTNGMQSGYHQGGTFADNGRISATADTLAGIRSIALHEAGGHAVQGREGFARGAAARGSGYVGLEDAVDIMSSWPVGSSLTKHIAELQAAGKLPLEYGTPRSIADRVNYWRNAGEQEARLVQDRAHMSPAELRKVDPKLMQSVPDDLQLVRGASGETQSAVSTKDLNRIVDELGLDATSTTAAGGTTYTKISDPKGAVRPLEVRVPDPNDPHGGGFRRWRLDTSAEGTRNPHPNHFNVAGEDYGDPAVLRARLRYAFGRIGPESTPAVAPVEGGPIRDPRQLKLLSRGLPPGFVLDEPQGNNAMVP